MIQYVFIKRMAKMTVLKSYRQCVGVYTIASVIFSVLAAVIYRTAASPNVITFLCIVALILFAPLYIGVCGYFMGVYREDGDTRIRRLFSIAFSRQYMRNVGGMLVIILWLALWGSIAVPILSIINIPITIFSLLGGLLFSGISGGAQYDFIYNATNFAVVLVLLIPMYIKVLSYSMAPYLLADYPQIHATEVLYFSKTMTKGYKGEILMMGLSLFGWIALSAITLGLVGLCWSGPYMSASFAGMYNLLKQRALATGIITEAELRDENPHM